jgi:hypothetical protein
MNNYAEITINGKKVGMLFSMIAAEDFYNLQLGKEQTDTPNNILAIGDAFYSGACCHAMLKREKKPVYYDFINAIDDLYSTEEGIKEIAEASLIWQESKFGKNVMSVSENLKKKEQQRESLQQTGNV